MTLCLLTPDVPTVSPDTPLLLPDGYDCGGPVGGGTLAVSSRPRAATLASSASGGLRSSRLRASTLDATLDE